MNDLRCPPQATDLKAGASTDTRRRRNDVIDAAHAEVELVRSQDYSETLRISPIPALTDAHDLLIESQLRSAADPVARHRRHRLVITRDSLQGLVHHLQTYLARIDASGKPQECTADGESGSRPHALRR